MTKEITLPLSKESCDQIKKYGGLTLWILATVGMLFVAVALWFNWWNWYITDRAMIGAGSAMGSSLSIILMLVYAKKKGFWITFQCRCEMEEKNESR